MGINRDWLEGKRLLGFSIGGEPIVSLLRSFGKVCFQTRVTTSWPHKTQNRIWLASGEPLGENTMTASREHQHSFTAVVLIWIMQVLVKLATCSDPIPFLTISCCLSAVFMHCKTTKSFLPSNHQIDDQWCILWINLHYEHVKLAFNMFKMQSDFYINIYIWNKSHLYKKSLS